MAQPPAEWLWSSFQAMRGQATCPEWLSTDGLLAQFAQRRAMARCRYRQFVLEGVGQESIWQDLHRQIFLGDASCVKRMQAYLDDVSLDSNIPKAHRRPPSRPLEEIEVAYRDRNEAMVAAYAMMLDLTPNSASSRQRCVMRHRHQNAHCSFACHPERTFSQHRRSSEMP